MSEFEFLITIIQSLADVFLRHAVPRIETEKPAERSCPNFDYPVFGCQAEELWKCRGRLSSITAFPVDYIFKIETLQVARQVFAKQLYSAVLGNVG